MINIVPLFPTNELILPGIRRRLRVIEPHHQRLIRSCVVRDHEFGAIAAHRDPGALVSFRENIYGVAASVHSLDERGKEMNVVVEGQWKFESSHVRSSNEGVLVAAVKPLRDEPITPIPKDFEWLLGVWQQLKSHQSVSAMKVPTPHNSRDLGWLLTLILPLSIQDQMYLLSLDYPNFRLKQLSELINALLEQMGQSPSAWSLTSNSRTLSPFLAQRQS